MEGPLNIRKLSSGDVDKYKILTAAVLDERGDAYWITREKAFERTHVEWLECCSEIGGERCGWGAFDNGTMYGSVEVFRSTNPRYQDWFPGEKMGVMGRLYKRSDCREEGLGKRLMQAAVEWCSRGNYPVLITANRVDNVSKEIRSAHEARLFQCGFQPRDYEEIENWADIPGNRAVQIWWAQRFSTHALR